MKSEQSTSRRGFLVGAAAGLAAASGAAAQQKKGSAPVLLYVGTYSSPQGPEGSRGRGEGIYLFEMDPSSGNLRQRDLFRAGNNPSCLALDPSHTHLYSANETSTYEGAASGSVSAFSIERSTASLTLLSTVSSQGAGPAHLSVHPSGKYVFVANYAGGTIAVLPIKPDGSLGAAVDVKADQGPSDPNKPGSSAPPGSFAISGHERPHAHMIQADPSGKFVIATDLALDRINVWQIDLATGKLTANNPPSVSVPLGDGPRHFAFHPNGRWMYTIQEESSTLIRFDWDGQRGTLTPRQTVSSLPAGFKGTDYTSEIMLSANGKFLYAANRLHDSIAVFAIGANGDLTFASEEWTRGDYPRSFNFDPSGRFLYSCNQRADAIAVFRVDPNSGRLAFTGQYVAVGTPSSIVFLDAK
jgi:6-phosphogluconolactonase (cycloisomerase 2 family)